jgi:hypothetical protein
MDTGIALVAAIVSERERARERERERERRGFIDNQDESRDRSSGFRQKQNPAAV